MNRKKFLTTLLGTSTLVGTSTFISMDGFSSIANALSHGSDNEGNAGELATFGAIHLNNTNLEKASHFWTQVVGMELRKKEQDRAEFGTSEKTLVVVHEVAKNRFKKGYSGLYHIAIHPPNKAAFAKMIYRLNENNYSYSPIDHSMSQSIYLDDPDGINVEFALETPERFKRVITEGGIFMETSDGSIRSASDRLDMKSVMEHLDEKDLSKPIDSETYIGHIHLYANNVAQSNSFYKSLGFTQFNLLPQFRYADVGAGGKYKHRIAMNSWHGDNRPLAPTDNAGMKHYELIFKSKDELLNGLKNIESYTEKDGKYWMLDPTGNMLCLSHA